MLAAKAAYEALAADVHTAKQRPGDALQLVIVTDTPQSDDEVTIRIALQIAQRPQLADGGREFVSFLTGLANVLPLLQPPLVPVQDNDNATEGEPKGKGKGKKGKNKGLQVVPKQATIEMLAVEAPQKLRHLAHLLTHVGTFEYQSGNYSSAPQMTREVQMLLPVPTWRLEELVTDLLNHEDGAFKEAWPTLTADELDFSECAASLKAKGKGKGKGKGKDKDAGGWEK